MVGWIFRPIWTIDSSWMLAFLLSSSFSSETLFSRTCLSVSLIFFCLSSVQKCKFRERKKYSTIFIRCRCDFDESRRGSGRREDVSDCEEKCSCASKEGDSFGSAEKRLRYSRRHQQKCWSYEKVSQGFHPAAPDIYAREAEA